MSLSALESIYVRLLDAYGCQGWWPLLEVRGNNPTQSGSLRGYHPGEYDYPRTREQQFEICVGAILTQNTAWSNVEKALSALNDAPGLSPYSILAASQDELEQAIRPSGYFRVKTRKLREFAAFFLGLEGATPSRAALLKVWGVGPETADSIRLYAYDLPEMVVDAYTRRILSHHGLVSPKASYDAVKTFCASGLPCEVVVYQEFHALMVDHAKRCYRRAPYEDPLLVDVGGGAGGAWRSR